MDELNDYYKNKEKKNAELYEALFMCFTFFAGLIMGLLCAALK